jgi:hypothetical protein
MDASCMQIDHDSNRPGERVLPNAELHREISAVVIQEVLGFSGQNRLQISPLQVLNFSSTFSIDWLSSAGRQGVFVKIPRVDIRQRQVGLVTPADRRFAGEEYDSLVRLSQAWKSADLGVSFVKPLTFLAAYNAIVTQRAYAREFFALFRRQDLCHRFRGPGAADRVLGCLKRLGQSLARYHLGCGEEGLFTAAATGKKIQGYLARLQELEVDRALLSQVARTLERLEGRVAPTHLTQTIKGLDVRNILISPEGQLFLLDPGKLKRDFKEADLARFLVTCRILHWGSLWFFLRLTPHGAYEESFLQGYYRGAKPNWIMTVFLIKELLKHWLMAYRAMGIKRWPRTLKAVLKGTYIDPFYRKQIAAELRKLSQQ